MKNKIHYLKFIFVLASLFACSKDKDDAPAPPAYIGNYVLTAFNTATKTDLNGDGTSSTNQLDEISCLKSDILNINADNTFKISGKDVNIDSTTDKIVCNSTPDVNGKWSFKDNTLILSATIDGETESNTFSIGQNTLSYKTDLPIVSLVNGIPQNVFSNVELIYTKK
jgi:hypothetical protein